MKRDVTNIYYYINITSDQYHSYIPGMWFFRVPLIIAHFKCLEKNCLTDINRDTTRQYTVPNNNTIVSQIDFAKSWFKARYMIMIPLTGVIIVNLFIFHKHGVKQRYILIIYPIHESSNQVFVNFIIFEQLKFCEQWISMCSWVNTWNNSDSSFCNFTKAFIYAWQESSHTWL